MAGWGDGAWGNMPWGGGSVSTTTPEQTEEGERLTNNAGRHLQRMDSKGLINRSTEANESRSGKR